MNSNAFTSARRSSSYEVRVGAVVRAGRRRPVGVPAAAAAATVRAAAVEASSRGNSQRIALGTAGAEDAAQDVGESVLEVAVRHDVDHRVERGIEVADPEKSARLNRCVRASV